MLMIPKSKQPSMNNIKLPSKKSIKDNKRLLSPIQINKNFDSLTISASNAGTKLNIGGEEPITKFAKFGSIADNSAGKSFRRMDIGTSIQVDNKRLAPTGDKFSSADKVISSTAIKSRN